MTFASALEAAQRGEPQGDQQLEAFLEAHPYLLDLVAAGVAPEDAMAALDEALDEALEDYVLVLVEADNKKHSPFKRKSELTTDAAVIGLPNPRGKARNRSTCKCSNYVCQCTRDDGTEFKVDMTRYYKSGDKAKYMDSWREITAKQD